MQTSIRITEHTLTQNVGKESTVLFMRLSFGFKIYVQSVIGIQPEILIPILKMMQDSEIAMERHNTLPGRQ